MDRQGQHLDCAERAVIFSGDQRGSSRRQIARLPGRSPGTICRELARGRPEGGAEPDCCPQRGQQVYDRRRLACRPKRKLLRGGETCLFVCRHLPGLRWSPEQIAATLRDLGEDQRVIHLQDGGGEATYTVDPHQFLGIELNPWAAAVAELVLWIGYLQWHFRTHGNASPAEPVLRDFRTIENRDAVLDWDSRRERRDDQGQPVTR